MINVRYSFTASGFRVKEIVIEQLPNTYGITPQLIKYLDRIYAPEIYNRRFELGGYRLSVTFLIDSKGYVQANINTDLFQDLQISPEFLKQLREAVEQILNDSVRPYRDLRDKISNLLGAGLLNIPTASREE